MFDADDKVQYRKIFMAWGKNVRRYCDVVYFREIYDTEEIYKCFYGDEN